jgi:hypothetical protein
VLLFSKEVSAMSVQLTPDQQRALDAHIARALHALLAGSMPNEADTTPLSGDPKACMTAMIDALNNGGAQAVRKAFLALGKDRPWLLKLASAPPPDLGNEAASNEQPSRRIRFLSTAEMLKRPGQQWIIPAILPRDSIALVYGLSGGFKSFLVMAWALSIGTGTPWLGRPVTRGSVAYIAAEGGYGIKKRVLAWMAFHRYADPETIGVKWYDQPLAMQDASNLSELLAALKEDFEEPPVLVVIDTLSRCAAGADEDSNTEMARVLASADIIREQMHCTVLIVHHVGKDQQKGPRGASALLCNVEAAIYVTPTTVGSKVECAKAKDARPFERLYLQTKEVSYGPTEDDVSLVLIAGEESDDRNRPAMTKDEAAMYGLLVGRELTWSEWVKAATDPERGEAQLTATAAKFAINGLRKAGRIQQREKRGPYSLVGPAGENDSPDGPQEE